MRSSVIILAFATLALAELHSGEEVISSPVELQLLPIEPPPPVEFIPFVNSMKFEFFTKSGVSSYVKSNFYKILDNKAFNKTKKTVIYSYGFTQTTKQEDVMKVINAYLQNNDFNFVIVNYGSILDYTVLNANSNGKNVAEALIEVFKRGYSNFHVVGFSLGAVVSGVIGRNVQSLSRGRFVIPRITGVDPGQLPPLVTIEELSKSDAVFVDTIHGETAQFGSATALGHVNFWLNNGIRFPECLEDATCSHIKTSLFFAATVRNKNPQLFIAKKCNNYAEYKNNNCSNITSPVGLYANESATGNYYLDITTF